MAIDPRLAAIIEKYKVNPQFLGTEIEDVNQPGAIDDTMLHIAAHIGAVADIEILVACGAMVDIPGDLGNTPLHFAAMGGRYASVKKLLELGANRNLRNEWGQTVLEVAELGGHDAVVRLLRDPAVS